jgi:hypothetical protein
MTGDQALDLLLLWSPRPDLNRRYRLERAVTSPASPAGTIHCLQRHGPARGVILAAQDLPAIPARRPPAQPCHPHGGCHPDTAPAQGLQRSVRSRSVLRYGASGAHPASPCPVRRHGGPRNARRGSSGPADSGDRRGQNAPEAGFARAGRPSLALAPDWRARGDSFAQDTRRPGAGKTPMFKAASAMITCAAVRTHARRSASRSCQSASSRRA